MEDDYYSIDSILSENQVLVLSSAHVLHVRMPYDSQKIQCTFKVDIPDMGHLDGGSHERDVRPTKPLTCIPSLLTPHARRARSNPRAKSSSRSGSPSFLSIRASGRPHTKPAHAHPPHLRRDYADFAVPPPFSSRVRNALNAEAKSVRLSALVGAGGLWYGFGKIIMRLSVLACSRSVVLPPHRLTLSTSLDEVPANEMSELLTKARSGRPSFRRRYATRRVDLPW